MDTEAIRKTSLEMQADKLERETTRFLTVEKGNSSTRRLGFKTREDGAEGFGNRGFEDLELAEFRKISGNLSKDRILALGLGGSLRSLEELGSSWGLRRGKSVCGDLGSVGGGDVLVSAQMNDFVKAHSLLEGESRERQLKFYSMLKKIRC